MLAPSPYFGDEKIWNAQTSPHSLYYDEKGRVWFAARIRPPANPDFCKKGSDHPSAKVYPIDQANRQVTMYDPKTQKFTDGQHLLPDPPCAVRLRRQQYRYGRARAARRAARPAGST